MLDNQFQDIARLTHYAFPNYAEAKGDEDAKLEVMLAILGAPELLKLAMRGASGENIDPQEFASVFLKEPEAASNLVQALAKSGQLNLGGSAPSANVNNPKPSPGATKKRGRR